MNAVTIVGGNIASKVKSSIIDTIHSEYFKNNNFPVCYNYNGNLPISLYLDSDLTLWFPDIPNNREKAYPIKKRGSVLICSKVMRDDTTRIDAVSRIFKMQGNAIVLIYNDTKPFTFELVDALNNTWCVTDRIETLVDSINKLYFWTKSSKRKSLLQNKIVPTFLENNCKEFIEINRKIALRVADGCGNRFFGNYSTRCTKLFPSMRQGMFLFSPRNIDKKFVTEKDLVAVTEEYYFGDRKPSVDTPVQIEIYKKHKNINYMIHGHAFIKGASTTNHYFPCGDLREVNEILNTIDKKNKLNLKKHGFLLLGETIDDMVQHLHECEFTSL